MCFYDRWVVLSLRGDNQTASLPASLGFGDAAAAVLTTGPLWGCHISPWFLSIPPLPLRAVGVGTSPVGLVLSSCVLCAEQGEPCRVTASQKPNTKPSLEKEPGGKCSLIEGLEVLPVFRSEGFLWDL